MNLDQTLLSSLQQVSLDDRPEFVIPLSGKYLCAFCEHGLHPPVRQTACGHRLCDTCVKKIQLEQAVPMCPGKDEECVVLTEENVYPDRGTDRELSNMEVVCPNKPSCKVTPKWRLLNQHIIQECKFNVISCPNAIFGCVAKFLQSEKENHLQRICEYSPRHCKYCNVEFPNIKLKQHEKKCKDEEARCDFSEEGCLFHGTRKEIYDHIHKPEAMANHLQMTMEKLRVEQKRTAELEQQVQNLAKKSEQLRASSTELQNEIQTVQQQSKKDLNEMWSVRSKNTQQADEVRAVAERSRLELRTTEERIASLEKKAHVLENKNGGSHKTGTPEDEIKTIKSNERMVAMHDVTLAEHEIRFRCLETTNYNGVLVWKITNYTSRKRAAVEGRTLSIYSQPFYTDPYGYKMCARIYLDGDGMGKSTHASLYFVVMKGEYDALLPWPFRQRVTMILLDQESKRQHIRDTFRPDPTSSSFRLPVNTMNIASGSPLFVAQSILESPTYLRDDTIYIMLRVDLSDLNHFGLAI